MSEGRCKFCRKPIDQANEDVMTFHIPRITDQVERAHVGCFVDWWINYDIAMCELYPRGGEGSIACFFCGGEVTEAPMVFRLEGFTDGTVLAHDACYGRFITNTRRFQTRA